LSSLKFVVLSVQDKGENFLSKIKLICLTFVVGLDDDGLPAGVATGQDKDDLASLHNFPHFDRKNRNSDFKPKFRTVQGSEQKRKGRNKFVNIQFCQINEN
jgi:hypothetical protein